MILIGQFDSPYTRRVAVSMNVLGLPFTRNPLSVFGDAEAMRKLNPLGRVPSLVLDDGEVLIDSAAILDHLDELVGSERALVPRSGQARREALRTIALATGAADKVVSLTFETLLRPASVHHQPLIERYRVQLDSALAALERVASPAWIDNGRPAQTAITTACMICHLRLRTPEYMPAGRYRALDRLSADAEALPAFCASRPADSETIPAAKG